MTATTHTAIAATGAASTDLMTTASQINHHHKLACIKAGEAVGHAVEAGKLLLSVKASLQHGDFGAWLTNNLNVTDRTARRYMAAALGKPLPVRVIKNDKLPPMIEAVKTDTVSVLEDAKTSPNQQALQQEHDAKRATVAWKAGERAYEKLNDAVSESQKIENQTKADISIRFKYMLSKKLYVHGGYKTFEEYCLDQFGWSPEEVEEIHTDAFLYNLSKGKGAAA